MGSVEALKNGKYRGVKRLDGKKVSEVFPTKVAAVVWADSDAPPTKYSSRRDASVPVALAPAKPTVGRPPMTLREFWEREYLAGALRKTTEKNRRQLMDAIILPRWGDTQLSLITHEDVQRWLMKDVREGGRNGGRKHNTVRGVYRNFHKVLGLAVDGGFLEHTPFDRAMQLPAKDMEERRYLTPEEVRLLTDAFDSRVRAFVPLCSYAGLRIGEALALRWRDIDDFRRTVTIVQSVSTDGDMNAPKTVAGRRTVPLMPQLAVVLRNHRDAGEGNVDGNALVFAGTAGKPWLAHNFRKRFWTPAVTRSGIGRVTPHELRHTAVSFWIRQGATPLQVSTWAGHTDVAFTFRTYGHLWRGDESAFSEKLGQLYIEAV